MFRHLPLLFVGLVVVEIWLLVAIGARIGGLATFGLLLGGAVVGAAVARRAGARALASWQEASMTGSASVPELADSAMIVLAGALIMMPGVVSDLAGVVLLVPRVRRALGGRVRRAFAERLRARGFEAVRREPAVGRIIDVDPADVRDADP